MIGIGVTTYQRPEHLELCLKNIGKYTKQPFRLFVYDDSTERRGIAYGKNECLKELKGSDYIFLLDDDCFPIANGWADFFVNTSQASGQHHFLYLKETLTIKKTESILFCEKDGELLTKINCEINIYDNCGGCFMFLTKEVIEKVGGYCKKYGLYGYEHAGYSHRIHAAGLTPMGKYLCPQGAGDYIFSLDYDYDSKYDYLCHNSSLQSEINKIPEYINQNRAIYLQDIQTIYQPL